MSKFNLSFHYNKDTMFGACFGILCGLSASINLDAAINSTFRLIVAIAFTALFVFCLCYSFYDLYRTYKQTQTIYILLLISYLLLFGFVGYDLVADWMYYFIR